MRGEAGRRGEKRRDKHARAEHTVQERESEREKRENHRVGQAGAIIISPCSIVPCGASASAFHLVSNMRCEVVPPSQPPWVGVPLNPRWFAQAQGGGHGPGARRTSERETSKRGAKIDRELEERRGAEV